MTIVEYFDPRNGKHLKAWLSTAEKASRHGLNVNWLAVHFAESCGIGNVGDYEWHDDWGQSIKDKMADAWMEQHLGSESKS